MPDTDPWLLLTTMTPDLRESVFDLAAESGIDLAGLLTEGES